jgi:hypothetical protein
LKAQKTVNSQGNTKQEEPEASEYLTSNYTTEPQQQKQHDTVTKIDMKTSGTE